MQKRKEEPVKEIVPVQLVYGVEWLPVVEVCALPTKLLVSYIILL